MEKLFIKVLIYLFISCAATAYCGFRIGLHYPKNINLPDEIKALSNDKNMPDTLTGYQINGVITIGFKH